MKLYFLLILLLTIFPVRYGLAGEIDYGLNLGYMHTSDASPIKEGGLRYYGAYVGSRKKRLDIGITKNKISCNDDVKVASYSQVHEVSSHKLLWGVSYHHFDSGYLDRCDVGNAIINLPTPYLGYKYVLSDKEVKVEFELQLHTYGISAHTRIGL